MEGFYITVKDNFLEKENLLELQKNLPKVKYAGDFNNINGVNHIWFSAPASKEITNIIKYKCEKLLNKKFKFFLIKFIYIYYKENIINKNIIKQYQNKNLKAVIL